MELIPYAVLAWHSTLARWGFPFSPASGCRLQDRNRLKLVNFSWNTRTSSVVNLCKWKLILLINQCSSYSIWWDYLTNNPLKLARLFYLVSIEGKMWRKWNLSGTLEDSFLDFRENLHSFIFIIFWSDDHDQIARCWLLIANSIRKSVCVFRNKIFFQM